MRKDSLSSSKVALALILLLAPACTKPPPVLVAPDPELVFVGRTFESALCGVVLKLKFNVKNTRLQPLLLSHAEVDGTYAGQRIEQQRLSLSGSVESQAEQPIVIPVAVKRGCDKLGNEPTLDTLAIAGRLYAEGGGEVVFEFEDKLDLPTPKQPKLEVEMIGQRYDDGRIEIIAQLKIKNPNPFAIMLDGGTYRVRLQSIEAASGEAWPDQRIPENAEVRYDVPIKIVPGEATPLSPLQKERRLTFEVESSVQLNAAPKFDFRKTGVVTFQ